MLQNRRRLLPVILYVVLIFAVSSIPSLTAPGPGFILKDKIAHTIEYSVLGFLLCNAFRWSVTSSRAATFAFLFAVGVSMAAIDEIYQSFVPGRLMSAFDWCADALGLAIGIIIFWLVGKNRSTRSMDGASELCARGDKRANRA